MNNLAKHICEFTCSPHQSAFMEAVDTKLIPETNGEFSPHQACCHRFVTQSFSPSTVSYIEGIDIHITEEYTNGTFNSCRNVIFPSSGQMALDLMCGNFGAAKCSPMRWYGYMGDATDNPYVPFQINYRPHNTSAKVDGFTPLNPRVVPCNESVDVSENISAISLDMIFVFYPGRETRMFVRRLRAIMPKATSTRAAATAFSHLGP